MLYVALWVGGLVVLGGIFAWANSSESGAAARVQGSNLNLVVLVIVLGMFGWFFSTENDAALVSVMALLLGVAIAGLWLAAREGQVPWCGIVYRYEAPITFWCMVVGLVLGFPSCVGVLAIVVPRFL